MTEDDPEVLEIALDGPLGRVAVEALRLDVRRLARRYGVTLKGFMTEPVREEGVDGDEARPGAPPSPPA